MFEVIKNSALTWIGIIGGAITLISNIQGIVELGKWADWLILKWRATVFPIFSGFIDLIGFKVSSIAISMIAMAVFVSAIAIGSNFEKRIKVDSDEEWRWGRGRIFNARVLFGIFMYSFHALIVFSINKISFIYNLYFNFPYIFISLLYVLYVGAIVIGLKGWPLWTSISIAASMIFFSFIFGYAATSSQEAGVSDTASFFLSGISAILCGLIVVGVAPPLTFTRRIYFLNFGVACVIALSQIGRLGASVTP
ncbi:hypothetical protein [Stappia indica]|uniref:hypothetical protein n=1 Tax=Stappia indica TaxID=538381 RepID=UPI001CD6FCA5|nr:hypothetical protein [Stappia indica]MCA1297007.1 hypothetical protein [Stappia indica]